MENKRIMNQVRSSRMGIGFKDGFSEIEQDAIDNATERVLQKTQKTEDPEIDMQMGPDYSVGGEAQS